MITISILTVKETEETDKISRPQRPIELSQYPDVDPERAWELANLIRIAARDYQCFNDWFNNVTEQDKGEPVYKEFTLEKDRKLEGISQENNNSWIYTSKEINNSTIQEYTLLTESDVNNQDSQFPDEQYYKYKILKTYEHLAYYPTKLDIDIDRFGFIAERKEGNKIIVFLVFRGTRELGEWFNNAQFKQVDFLAREEDDDGIEGYGKISLGFNKMYTGFRPGIFIDYGVLNAISRTGDSIIRNILNRIDDVKITYKSIYQAVNEYFSNLDTNEDVNIYVTGHSLGGALATIATMHIAEKDQLKTPINLYSFASPRVGDNSFADKFNQLSSDKIKAFRFANSEDLVTKIPLPIWFKAGLDLDNSPLLDLTRTTFNTVTGGIFDKDYQHVGFPVYFTHQARRFNKTGNLEETATVGDNHNMTSSYCGALEQK
ncbi:MAG: lipase family protein [Cyanobacteria bacterium P01_F01_bin.143]